MENAIFNLKPDVRYKTRKFYVSFLLGVILTTFVYTLTAYIMEFNMYSMIYLLSYLIFIVVIAFLSFVCSKELYQNSKYKITETRLIITNGWLNIKADSIDLVKIVDMNTIQSMYEKKNNLGTIQILARDQSKRRSLKVYKMHSLSNYNEIENKIRELIQKRKGKN